MMKSSILLSLILLVLATVVPPIQGAPTQEHSSQSHSMDSPEGYYNEALVAETAGNLPNASLALRRALVLNPQFAQARDTLHDILEKMGVPIQQTWRTKLLSLCSPDFLVLVGSFIGWSAAFLVVWIFFTRYCKQNTSEKKRIFFLLILSLLICALGWVIVFLGTIIDPRRDALESVVVIAQDNISTSTTTMAPPQENLVTAVLRSTPIENGPILAQIPTGTLLLLRSTHGVWSYVKMESGLQGWIASSALQPLVPRTK